MCGLRVFLTLWIMGMLNKSFGEQLLLTTIDRCGEAPGIENGDVVERSGVQLKYQCKPGYNLHGEDTVLCFSNSSWSELPLCKEEDIPCRAIRCEEEPYVFLADVVECSRTLVKFQCRPGYKFHGGDTLQCFSNGSWSEMPFCIENSACIEPEIANANITKFLFVRDNEGMWIACNAGYEDRKKRTKLLCQNGQWSELPVCEKMDSSCGPPPSISNGTIINQVHKEVFPEGTRVKYVCDSGFELETSTNEAICSYDEWFPAPSCRVTDEKNTEGQVAQTTGYVISSGADENISLLFTTIDKCGAAPVIEKGVAYYETNMFIAYQCHHLYKLKGSSVVRCANGQWSPLPTCEVNFCKLDTSKHSVLLEAGDVYIKSGTEKSVVCVDLLKAYAECRDNQLYLSYCCRPLTFMLNLCPYVQITSSQ